MNKNTEIPKKLNLDKDLSKIWDLKGLSVEEKIKEEDYIGYMDDTNVFMIIPKNNLIKLAIENNFKTEEPRKQPLNLNYVNSEYEAVSVYSVEYLRLFFKLISHYKQVKIKVIKDYPMWLETDDFIIILAPQVGSIQEEQK